MENTTKALLIAGVVLVTIVLIALGILLVKNISETSKQADATGQLLSNATDKASVSVSGGLKGLIISKEKFNKTFEKWEITSKDQLDSEIYLKNEKLKDQIELIGWVYNKINYKYISKEEGFPTIDTTGLTKETIGEAILQWCKEKENERLITRLDNPLNNETIKQKCKEIYEGKTGYLDYYYSFDEYFKVFKQSSKYGYKSPIRFSCFWTYDETGYVNKVYFVAGILYDENIAKKAN